MIYIVVIGKPLRVHTCTCIYTWSGNYFFYQAAGKLLIYSHPRTCMHAYGIRTCAIIYTKLRRGFRTLVLFIYAGIKLYKKIIGNYTGIIIIIIIYLATKSTIKEFLNKFLQFITHRFSNCFGSTFLRLAYTSKSKFNTDFTFRFFIAFICACLNSHT